MRFIPLLPRIGHSSISIIGSTTSSKFVASKMSDAAVAGRVRSTPTLPLQQQQQQRRRQSRSNSSSSLDHVSRPRRDRGGKHQSFVPKAPTKRPQDSKRSATAHVSAREVKPFLTQINNRIGSIHQILLLRQHEQVMESHTNYYHNKNTDVFLDPIKDDTMRAAAIVEEAREQSQQILAELKMVFGQTGNEAMIRKFRPELSVLLERLLHVYSQMAVQATAAATTTTTTTTTPSAAQLYQECLAIFKVLDTWNLDKQHAHYQAAILAASAAEQWSAAADWFWNQIDPDSGGYVPMTIDSLRCIEPSYAHSTSNMPQLILQQPPVVLGLVAVAKAAQQRMRQASLSSSKSSSSDPQNDDHTSPETFSSPPCGMPVVDAVMDAVLRMTMVSPNDQEKRT